MNNQEAIKRLKETRTTIQPYQYVDEAIDMAIMALEQDNTVSLEAFKQVMWERDIAIEQLHELGYEFGQKIEPSGDLIRRQAMDEIKELMTDINGDTVYAVRMSYIRQLPSANPQGSKTEALLELLEKTYSDFCECEGGEGYLKIDGKEYNTDAGYAIEGMSIFVEVLKQRLAEK